MENIKTMESPRNTESLAYICNRVMVLAIYANTISGQRKFNYEDIKPKTKVLRQVIEKLKEECKNEPAILSELDYYVMILDAKDAKSKSTKPKTEDSEPGERE